MQVLHGLVKHVVHIKSVVRVDKTRQLSAYSDIGVRSHCAGCEETLEAAVNSFFAEESGALMPRKFLTILWQRGRKEFMS